jgi:hypothetical protein
MKETTTTEYFKMLHKQYMAEVKRFIVALKENASRSELVDIRTNVKRLLTEIQSQAATMRAAEMSNPGEAGF